ncbi:MAG: isoprenylcysteine carboxylmethyltransferase family protein [Acidocella sp.]|nr:isoprenylcysteine carboxylmethyltransferase family protein [Acidocella sp.]
MKPSAAAPNSLPWPPMIYGAAALAAWLLNRLIPFGMVSSAPLHLLGGALMLAGAMLDLSAMLLMYRRRANILPHRAATALVTAFPFSISRNPIYLGNTILLAGAALAFNNLWLAAFDIAAVQAVTILAIQREEAHLAVLFGSAWQNYAQRVPRWLGVLSNNTQNAKND